jgi:hypothetical protein
MPIGRLHTVLSLTHAPKACNRRVNDRAQADALFIVLGIAIIFRVDDENDPSVEITGRETRMAVQDILRVDAHFSPLNLHFPWCGLTGTDGDDWDDEEDDEDAKEKDEEEGLKKDEEEEDDDLIHSKGLAPDDACLISP